MKMGITSTLAGNLSFRFGKDAFHRVRDVSGAEWDAVERVLTRFMMDPHRARTSFNCFSISAASCSASATGLPLAMPGRL